ncbi:MAG TPA: ABC transporter ATP-binding protein, partial [Candidatus Gastranaerophilaceae bacterium]|nr:ABC transporter ATP-binding protein [Candidatus Gastranaerophilaceae bacterium]
SMVVGGGMTTNFNETFSGNKIIAAYNLQEQQNSAFESQINEQFNLSMTLTKRVGWLSPIMYFVASCGIAIVMAYGNHLIMTGEITSGSFAAFVTSLLLLYKPVKGLGQTLAGLQSTFVAMSRTFELFDLVPEIKNEPDAIELKGFEKQIEFKNVNFEYIEDTPVLKNLCLAVPKNETIALVGNSGGGKSTVVNLIPRFYDVKSGSIEIDGVNIKNFDLVSLRNQISFVFQDNFLFSGTIKENIIMGNKQASDEELQNVVKMAHLDEFIETLEKGIDTYVGERGATLSGGQRQRVAIARAMLKNAPIVILDEATSALDNKSEAIVQKALDNLMKNKTVFVIAHRLSTIKNADRIAVINEGELVELGTHDNLMRIENGKYKHLYEMQFKKVEQLNS